MEQTQTALSLSDTFFIAPVVEVHAALVRHQAMKDFVESALRVNVDFGKIPGTDKSTLLKPGAEKLANFFGLAPTFEIVEKELDWTGEHHGDEAFFYFHYRCRLLRGDRLAAEGEGSASSFEKKYRWRLSEIVCPECGKPAIKKSKYPPRDNPRALPGWYCHDKAGGCGANFSADDKRITEQPRGQVKNPDVADIVNTLQKMAQKRAYVAAVLLAVNGSEYFTQDMEDFIDVEIVDTAPSHPAPAVPAEAPVPAATAKTNGAGDKQPAPAPTQNKPATTGALPAGLTMSFAMAKTIKSGSTEELYIDIPTASLSGRLSQKLKIPAPREELVQMEIDAIKTILYYRNHPELA